MADAHCSKRLWRENNGLKRTSMFEETTNSSDEGEHQMSVFKEEVSDPRGSGLGQQSPALLQVKKEDRERWADPEGGRLIEREEPDDTSFPFTVVTVKIEDDDENLPSSGHQHVRTEDSREAASPASRSAEQMETEPHREDCGGPEPDGNPGANTDIRPTTDENASASSETEVSGEDEDGEGRAARLSGSGSEDEDWGESGTRLSGETSSRCLDEADLSTTEPNAESQKARDEKKLFVCDDCGKPFYYLYHLKRHMARHTGEKPFQCDECGKKFSLRGNLNQHMTIHKGEKPFACSFCDRRFRLSSYLQAHVVTHLGVKAFACQHCGESFTREGALKRHVVRHTGVKPFACAICDKRFYRRSDLKYHTPVHSREHKVSSAPRNFACDECGKRFVHKSHVTRHMITHTGDKSFSCDVCGVLFKWQSALKRHRRRFHNQ
ncbi:zinc finger protein 771 isoform X3 [Fundulus heteroclitus]|uniref:zinc finger protein 771 isoform X3 n=1 Tax=Fundulus heteroclitus TaxID=8078 RepID=UPI00165B2231|nr:zinc finger protein 771 isoform X3 [Fundulus heteroclitus]XP_035998127.1 zinc finger protein 771 isoform X3 [Fundulus heteroclitus]